MSRWRCRSCGGEYDDLDLGGVPYFHACPPDRDPETREKRERADKRDENVDVVLVPDDRRKTRVQLRAEGRGREAV